jgi:hypothetical protein
MPIRIYDAISVHIPLCMIMCLMDRFSALLTLKLTHKLLSGSVVNVGCGDA